MLSHSLSLTARPRGAGARANDGARAMLLNATPSAPDAARHRVLCGRLRAHAAARGQQLGTLAAPAGAGARANDGARPLLLNATPSAPDAASQYLSEIIAVGYAGAASRCAAHTWCS